MAGKQNNLRQFLLTFEVLSDLGTELTAARDFSETARIILDSLLQTVNAREGALFTFNPRPAMLTSIAARGFAHFPQLAMVPLMPRQVAALTAARVPQIISSSNHSNYLTSNGNVSPELFKCIAPLKVAGKLVGLVAFGRREEEADYGAEEIDALALLANYVALAVHNHTLAQSLEQRITEHLRLLGSMHRFYDNALETFAHAVDIKHVNVHGHSVRVARFAAGIGDAMGLDATEVAAVKAGGYLHDIGMVTVDTHIWSKPARLDDREFREMADHTIVGHRIVSGVEFPWQRIPDVVRGHHERVDGSGYPDRLRLDETPLQTRIVAVADTFDAMTSERPWRQPMTVGESLAELVKLTPGHFDPVAVQSLLVQVRRDVVGSAKTPFFDQRTFCNIGVSDIDNLASTLLHKLNNNRTYHA